MLCEKTPDEHASTLEAAKKVAVCTVAQPELTESGRKSLTDGTCKHFIDGETRNCIHKQKETRDGGNEKKQARPRCRNRTGEVQNTKMRK
jgi:hypothetical protein